MVVGGIVIGAVVLALTAGLARIRERRALRYGALAAAVGGAIVCAALTASGNGNVDSVERFHFVEYGVITWLFYRAWHARADATALIFPLLAGVVVGAVDEGFQWLLPARVGELRDVLLDAAAVACGLVFSLGLEPPLRPTPPNERGRRELAAFAAAAILTLALFVRVVHLGYEIRDPETGAFRSRYTAEQLLAASQDRSARWQIAPPAELHRLSIEDHYLAEGIWHIQRRNEIEDVWAKWSENLILEKYFAPVLGFPTYLTPRGARWPKEQRDNAAAQGVRASQSYVSNANPYPIYAWNRWLFWVCIMTCVAVLTTVAFRRAKPGT